MLSVSRFVWDLPTPLQSVSTPWRFLSLAVFSAALVGGLAVKQIKNSRIRIAVYLLLITLALYGNRNHMRINDVRNYDQSFLESYTGVATGWNEYLPIWVKDMPHEFPQKKLEVLANNGTELIIQLNTTYYPGWQVKVDGEKVAIRPSDNGLIIFNAPVDYQRIESKFIDTPIRRNSKTISLVTLFVVILYYSRYRFNYIRHIFLGHVRIKR
jgi:hypothetical protein